MRNDRTSNIRQIAEGRRQQTAPNKCLCCILTRSTKSICLGNHRCTHHPPPPPPTLTYLAVKLPSLSFLPPPYPSPSIPSNSNEDSNLNTHSIRNKPKAKWKDSCHHLTRKKSRGMFGYKHRLDTSIRESTDIKLSKFTVQIDQDWLLKETEKSTFLQQYWLLLNENIFGLIFRNSY